MTKQRLSLLAACLALAACSSAAQMTPYQEPGLTGGVSARLEADGTWLVIGSGNAYTPVEAMADYTWLKAAETVKAEDQTCFEVISQYAAMSEDSFTHAYGTYSGDKPSARLRFRILEGVTQCEHDADEVIARLRPKIANRQLYFPPKAQ